MMKLAMLHAPLQDIARVIEGAQTAYEQAGIPDFLERVVAVAMLQAAHQTHQLQA